MNEKRTIRPDSSEVLTARIGAFAGLLMTIGIASAPFLSWGRLSPTRWLILLVACLVFATVIGSALVVNVLRKLAPVRVDGEWVSLGFSRVSDPTPSEAAFSFDDDRAQLTVGGRHVAHAYMYRRSTGVDLLDALAAVGYSVNSDVRDRFLTACEGESPGPIESQD